MKKYNIKKVSPWLKKKLQDLNEQLQPYYLPPVSAVGYVKGKSLAEALTPHLGKKYLLKNRCGRLFSRYL
jgi:hypothetical protein